MDAVSPSNHWRTIAAVFVSLVLLIPAMFLISIAWGLSGIHVPSDDFSDTWLPVVLAFPIRLFGVFALGLIGSGLAFLGALHLVKGASVEAAGYAFASITGTATIGLVCLVVLRDNDIFRHMDTLAQGAGWAIGPFLAASSRL